MVIHLSGIVSNQSFSNIEIELDGDVQIGGTVSFGEKTVINGNGYKIESFGDLIFDGGAVERNKNIINNADISYTEGSFSINGFTINDSLIQPPNGSGNEGSFLLKNSTIVSPKDYTYIWYPTQNVTIVDNMFLGVGPYYISGLTRDADILIEGNEFHDSDYSEPLISDKVNYETSKFIVLDNKFFEPQGEVFGFPSGYSGPFNLSGSGNIVSTTESDKSEEDYVFDNEDDLSVSEDIDAVKLLILNKSSEPQPPAPVPTPTPAPVPTPMPESIPAPVPVPTPEPSLTDDPPNLIKATLRGNNITLQFDYVLSDTLPSNGRFTLNQRNREYLIVDTAIRASEGIVTLTAEKILDPTVALTLDYLDFAGDQTQGVIESSTGVDLESFTGFTLNNQGSQDNTLTIDEGEFEGNQISLFLSAPISDAIPSKRRFKVKSANKKQKVLDISTEPDEGLVVLTTQKNLDLQESIFVSYRDLSGDQADKVLEDLAGNDMATIRNFEIISSGNDAIAPMVSSATLDDNILAVEFDSIIRNTSISKNRFKVKVDGKRVRVSSATVEQDDSYVELALNPKNLGTIDINSSVTLAYKDPKGDQTRKVVEDIFGNDLDSFSGYGVETVKV